jgi:hypothetical protein
MHLAIPTPAAAPMLITSAYSLWDFRQPLNNLGWYAFAILPFPSFLVTPILFCASIRQFTENIGRDNSITMHFCWAVVLLFQKYEFGWYFFSLSYVFLHSEIYNLVHAKTLGRWICFTYFEYFDDFRGLQEDHLYVLNTFMQKICIAHGFTQFVCKEGALSFR